MGFFVFFNVSGHMASFPGSPKTWLSLDGVPQNCAPSIFLACNFFFSNMPLSHVQVCAMHYYSPLEKKYACV